MKEYRLYLDSPAADWEHATPIGCGRMGAMIYGAPGKERLQLSEERIWSGVEGAHEPPAFREKLDHLRELLLSGRAAEADDWAAANMKGDFARIMSYETAGDLLIDTGDGDGDGTARDYRRDLDLLSGVAKVSYVRDGHAFQREYFASYPDDVIALRLSGLMPEREVCLTWEREHIKSVSVVGDTMTVEATTADGRHEFTVLVKAVTSGRVDARGNAMVVTGDEEITLLITAAVGKKPSLPALMDWEELKQRAQADHISLMERSEIRLDAGDDPALADLPVNKRLERMRAGETDGGLIGLYYQFGRYLMVGSSRRGTLPANLQGVWNGYMEAPWSSDYHTNINLQMNYWPVESANLSECAEPLFDYMNANLLESGKRTARVSYHCRGSVTHHLSDIYGFTAPADGLWGLWPLGGAWLCFNMWEHYLYGGDMDFLRDTAYEFIRQSTLFFLDYMIEVGEGDEATLLTGPSTSPENCYYDSQGRRISLCMSPAMDVEVVGGLLKIYIECEKLLGRDPATAEQAEAALKKMPPLKIGRRGNLMEWMEDYDEPEPGHRHISHMFALYPGDAINSSTPELMRAARKAIELRLAAGGGHTGWSCAWLICLFARLGDGENAMKMVNKLFANSTLDNLLDTHPPFQIDGNFGAVAGLAEMLLQSHGGVVSLLPALSASFPAGEFTGLRARGGMTVDARWENGRVCAATIAADRDVRFVLRMNGDETEVQMKAGQKQTFGEDA